MALPPIIPTSFVPRSTSTAPRKFRADLTGVFGLFSYAVLIIVFIFALVVFLYGRVLESKLSTKEAELSKAEASIDMVTVNSFLRLRDRLTSGEALLNNHIAFSGFFSSLEKIMPSTVRFSTIHLFVDDDGVVKLEGTGVAKSFNALAATSAAFAGDGRIKDAIFSNIIVSGKDNSVSFALSAVLDPKIIAFLP